MRTGIFGSNNLTLNAPLTETRTDDDARHTLQLCRHIVGCHVLAVDEVQLGFHIVIDSCKVQTLTNTLIGILQVVFPHQSDMNHASGIALFVKEIMPRFHLGRLPYRNTYLAQNGSIKSLALHTHRHIIDARHIFALHHTFQIDITERRHLQSQ